MDALLAQIAKEGSLAVTVLMVAVLGLAGAVTVLFAGWRQDVKDRRDSMAQALDKLTEAINSLRIDLARGKQ